MKITCIVLFILSLTSGFAQSPLDFSGTSIDYLFEEYAQGLDETFFTPQVIKLRGKVKSCVIERIVAEPEPKADGINVGYVFHQMNYSFNADSRLSELEINTVHKPYGKAAFVSKKVIRHGFVWEGEKLKLQSFLDVEMNSTKLSVPEYNSDGRIRCEHWYRSSNGVFVEEYPIAVTYAYQPNRGFEITGKVKRYDERDEIVKYSKTFDSLGRIVKRSIYNRDLRLGAKNDPLETETFDYQYNDKGQIVKLIYSKGNSTPIVYFYNYKEPDALGNYRIQQVLDKDQKLLYEIGWTIEYYD